MKFLQEAYHIIEEKDFKEKLFLIWLVCVLATHGVIEGVQISGFILCLAGIISIKLLRSPFYWIVLGYFLALNQIENYFHSANHYWLLIYTTIAIGLYKYLQNKKEYNFNIFRYLLIVVFGFATFYKIKSSFFRSGRLLTDYVLSGDNLPSTFGFIYGEKFETALKAYELNSEILASRLPISGQTIELVLPDPSYIFLIQVITVSVIIAELLIFLAFIIPKYFYSKHIPLIVIIFVWSTFLMRNEYGFFSLLCILTYFARPNMIRPYKLAMVATIALFLAFEISDISILF